MKNDIGGLVSFTYIFKRLSSWDFLGREIFSYIKCDQGSFDFLLKNVQPFSGHAFAGTDI